MSAKVDDVVTIIHNGEPTQALVTDVRDSSHGISYAIAVDSTYGRLLVIRWSGDEGVTWMRGHNPTICAALRAAFNLSDVTL